MTPAKYFDRFSSREEELRELIALWISDAAPNRKIRRRRISALKRSVRKHGRPPAEYFADEPFLVRAIKNAEGAK